LSKRNNSPRRSAAGFSLIELLIVLAIIMIIASISIPYLLAAKKSAYEAAAVSLLRQLHQRQVSHLNRDKTYSDQFGELGLTLGSAGTGSCKGGGGNCDVLVSQGYIFTLDTQGDDKWDCSAEPVRDRSTGRYFFVDQSGVIRFKHGKRAKKNDPPI
jgi:prepilin-type N-terminal cleavage/methylation domain-containing protein